MRVVLFRILYFGLCGWAAAQPWMGGRQPGREVREAPAWPATFEGRPIYPMALTPGEQRFNEGFPGAVARFSDGERQFIFRWATSGTRKLHSSADCFRGLGYRVTSEPPRQDGRGDRWGCFTARRGPHRLIVRERITDSGSAQSWCDVSDWYWSALLRNSRGPWLAVTIIEPDSGRR